MDTSPLIIFSSKFCDGTSRTHSLRKVTSAGFDYTNRIHVPKFARCTEQNFFEKRNGSFPAFNNAPHSLSMFLFNAYSSRHNKNDIFTTLWILQVKKTGFTVTEPFRAKSCTDIHKADCLGPGVQYSYKNLPPSHLFAIARRSLLCFLGHFQIVSISCFI